MSQKTPLAWRAAQIAAFTVGGGVALTFALAGSASADEVTVQDAHVTNVGAAAANSGGNVAVGNASQNTAACGQGAVGVVASNSCQASNASDGSADVKTGDATAVGNDSETEVAQSHDGGDGGGLAVTVQHSDTTNAGLAAANSGGNVGVGNASQNTAACLQGAAGLIASNTCDASNASDGSVSIETGDATAVGNHAKTKTSQHAGVGDGAGLAMVVQDSDVDNFGAAAANSGGNIGLGNVSNNLALNLQGAFGLIASNNGSAKNASNGSTSIKTGNATAVGNSSDTEVEQDADVDPAGLAVVFQSAPVLNAGIGVANSGGNVGVANGSHNVGVLAQVSFGLLSFNNGSVDNWSDGFLMIVSGDATGIGNRSSTTVKQTV